MEGEAGLNIKDSELNPDWGNYKSDLLICESHYPCKVSIPTYWLLSGGLYSLLLLAVSKLYYFIAKFCFEY